MPTQKRSSGEHYDVAISYIQKEDQPFAETIVESLRKQKKEGLSMFAFYEHDIVPKNIPKRFSELFLRKTNIVVVLHSNRYGRSGVSKIELGAIKKRTKTSNPTEWLIFVRPCKYTAVPRWISELGIGYYTRRDDGDEKIISGISRLACAHRNKVLSSAKNTKSQIAARWYQVAQFNLLQAAYLSLDADPKPCEYPLHAENPRLHEALMLRLYEISISAENQLLPTALKIKLFSGRRTIYAPNPNTGKMGRRIILNPRLVDRIATMVTREAMVDWLKANNIPSRFFLGKRKKS